MAQSIISSPGVVSFVYDYDANKNKTKETIASLNAPTMAQYGFGTAFPAEYDDEDRLTIWRRDDGSKNLTWALTKVGDWDLFYQSSLPSTFTYENRTHGDTHELTAITGTSPNSGSLSYDVKGNLTQDNTKSPAHNYVWDFDNQLSDADVDGAAGNEISYTYDALGRRVSKTFPVSGTPTTIVFVCTTHAIEHSPHAGQVLAEYTSAALPASTLRKFVYATYIDEPVMLIDRTALGVLPAGTEEKFYYHSNSLFKVAALTDAAGLPVERYAYDPYGNLTILDPTATTLRTVSSFSNPYTYTGRRLDDETGLYYFRARYFDGVLGRFIGRDVLNYLGSESNLYLYVASNPVAYLDPGGTIIVTGPEAAAVGFIDPALISVDDRTYLAFSDEAKKANPDTKTSAIGYHKWLGMVKELQISGNPTPAATYVSWGPLLNSKEFRHFMRGQVEIDCQKGSIAGVRVNWDSHQGYTPYRNKAGGTTFKYDPGLGSAEYSVAYANAANAATWTDNRKGASCVRVTFKNQFKIGGIGAKIAEKLAGVAVPYAWSDFEYTLCCNCAYSIRFHGSDVPTHLMYINKAQVAQANQRNLAEFTFRTPGARSAGRELSTQGGIAGRGTAWTITDSGFNTMTSKAGK